ncbi:protein root UVB sensitive 5-like isoform X1 [Zingiber officinale]|uniref:protein root UVB sensitive 5-like isoform X1 n=1 Tax=Zingiber officinale TaxID=94328 RepID=UPI001C4D49DC|nr:protein root UVB sensitive 5-like isoform X1 [Zingiber officinale]XP_042465311.1 protein root UVB sensitive 5-like isoform X1 [Zingiber officinale]
MLLLWSSSHSPPYRGISTPLSKSHDSWTTSTLPPGNRRRHPLSLVRLSGPADAHGGRRMEDEEGMPQSLFVERYQDGTAKRYILDHDSQTVTFCDEYTSLTTRDQEQENFLQFSLVPSALKDFILPTGYPGSVSDDYLDYMLWQFPTNITGWICHALVTSSLLKAVGLGSFSGAPIAASAAAIRWVSKDGLGAIGRLFIGGRLGNIFDDDPKRWRMYADFIGSAGSIFELSTQLCPAYFLPLAASGNLAKAVARGLKDPSFRVIQNHFAISANLGEVAAKEEVWEVAAQLIGLAIGILILEMPGIQTSFFMLILTWLSIRLLHLCLRFQSLSVLKFQTINLKRARMLVRSHVLNHIVPGYAACNKEENFLSWERFLQPKIIFGVSMQRMIGKDCSSHMVRALLKLYSKEHYVLYMQQQEAGEHTFLITFKVGATRLLVLRSLWQVYWLHKHQDKTSNHIFSLLEESLLELEDGFTDFLGQLKEAGWNENQITLKVPEELLFDESECLKLSSS